jgi:hypothetical protein
MNQLFAKAKLYRPSLKLTAGGYALTVSPEAEIGQVYVVELLTHHDIGKNGRELRPGQVTAHERHLKVTGAAVSMEARLAGADVFQPPQLRRKCRVKLHAGKVVNAAAAVRAPSRDGAGGRTQQEY